jgi:hypothetical protein
MDNDHGNGHGASQAHAGPPSWKPKSRKHEAVMRRKATALQLRLGGASYEQIGRALGYYHRAGAYKLVRQALHDMVREPAEEFRTLEIERLDRMFRAVYVPALNGDLEAMDRAITLLERRAKLLGLDRLRPVRVTVAGEGTSPADDARRIEQLLAAARARQAQVAATNGSTSEPHHNGTNGGLD